MQQSRVRKFTSLFIKLSIIGISLCYIYKQVIVKGGKDFLIDAFHPFLSKENALVFLTAIFLMFFNWTLEALKWKILIRDLEKISLESSLQAVLSGITISIFAPNRTGEFAGRIFYLKNANHMESAILAFAGSAIQLLVTVMGGFIGFLLFIHSELSDRFFIHVNLLWYISGSAFLILAFIFFLRFYLIKRKHPVFQTVKNLSWNLLIVTFFLSVLRYFVFSIQYYLLLELFNCGISPFYGLIFIPLTFFVISVVPTFALTEIGVRGAAALYFIGMVSANRSGILSSSFLLWIINLAFPALVGIFFIFRLRFFRNDIND